MRWVDCEQNTEEWESLRIGRIGGSELHTIMANYGKAFGDPASGEAPAYSGKIDFCLTPASLGGVCRTFASSCF